MNIKSNQEDQASRESQERGSLGKTADKRSVMDLPQGLSQYLRILAASGIESLPAKSDRISATCWTDWLERQEHCDPVAETNRLPHRPSPPNQSGLSNRPSLSHQSSLSNRPSPPNRNLPSAESDPPVHPPLPVSKRETSPNLKKPVSPAAFRRGNGSGLPLAEREESLKVLQAEVENCRRCPALVSCRSRTVFGTGNLQPRLVFLGEAPGEEEDRTGVPFVGAAGQLLNKILAACDLKREEVYLLNTVKCRPPLNRNPAPEELDNCWEYTLRQLQILNPEFICCLGAVASKRLLQTELPLGKLRQRFHDFQGIKVLVTYHPAYLLRTDSAKKQTWEDMQMLLKEMGLEIPNRK